MEKWHQLCLPCLKCNRPLTIIKVHFCAEGTFLVEGLCAPCGQQFSYQSSFAQQVARCYVADKVDCGEFIAGTELIQ